MAKTPQLYTTTDTALAAYLIISGIKPLQTQFNKDPVQFQFPANGNSLDKLVMEWEAVTATGNIGMFHYTYKRLVDQIKKHNNHNKES